MGGRPYTDPTTKERGSLLSESKIPAASVPTEPSAPAPAGEGDGFAAITSRRNGIAPIQTRRETPPTLGSGHSVRAAGGRRRPLARPLEATARLSTPSQQVGGLSRALGVDPHRPHHHLRACRPHHQARQFARFMQGSAVGRQSAWRAGTNSTAGRSARKSFTGASEAYPKAKPVISL